MLPKVLDEHQLAGRSAGNRAADDAWVEALSMTIFSSAPATAADAVGAALAEGFSPDAIGEAISLAANQLVLRDPGRQAAAGIARQAASAASTAIRSACTAATRPTPGGTWPASASARNQFACLILGAFHVAIDRSQLGGEPCWPRSRCRSNGI